MRRQGLIQRVGKRSVRTAGHRRPIAPCVPLDVDYFHAPRGRPLARCCVSSQAPEHACRNVPLILEEQFIDGELRYLALGETGAGRRLAFVFTTRGARVRIVTAYAMTPRQQEIYEEG